MTLVAAPFADARADHFRLKDKCLDCPTAAVVRSEIRFRVLDGVSKNPFYILDPNVQAPILHEKGQILK
jgi:hypothetical protein